MPSIPMLTALIWALITNVEIDSSILMCLWARVQGFRHNTYYYIIKIIVW